MKIILLSCLILVAGCALGTFQPQDISCSDVASQGDIAKVRAGFRNPDGDLYFLANADKILADIKNLANQGNDESMYLFASAKRETIIIRLMHGGKPVHNAFPDSAREEMVSALTYLYISVLAGGEYKNRSLKLIHEFEEKRSNFNILPEWIEEAKNNAEKWKAYCGSSVN